MSGHQGPILKIIALEPEKITKGKIQDDPKIISCSLDNTIRFWDAKEMNTLSVMESPEHSELSCMTYLMNCGLVATGHEDGSIRTWNLEINSFLTITQGDYEKVHTNTVSCIEAIQWKESEFLIAGGYDGIISVWDISEQKTTSANSMLNSSIIPSLKTHIHNNSQTKKGSNYPSILDSIGNEIHCILFDEINENIIVGGNNIDINMWSMQTGDKVGALKGEHQDSVTCMAME